MTTLGGDTASLCAGAIVRALGIESAAALVSDGTGAAITCAALPAFCKRRTGTDGICSSVGEGNGVAIAGNGVGGGGISRSVAVNTGSSRTGAGSTGHSDQTRCSTSESRSATISAGRTRHCEGCVLRGSSDLANVAMPGRTGPRAASSAAHTLMAKRWRGRRRGARDRSRERCGRRSTRRRLGAAVGARPRGRARRACRCHRPA